MRVDDLLALTFVPEADLLVLATSYGDTIRKGKHGHCVSMSVHGGYTLPGLNIPKLGGTVPGATDELVGEALGQTVHTSCVPIQFLKRAAL